MSATDNLIKLNAKLAETIESFDAARAEFQVTNETDKAALTVTLDQMKADMASLKTAITENEGYFAPGAEPFDAKTGKGFSVARTIYGIARGDIARHAPYEFDVIKAQGLQVDSAGGFMVPENLTPGLIKLLQARELFNAENLGVTVMPGVGGMMKFNRIKTAVTPSSIAQEGTTIPKSQLAIEQFSMDPKTCGVRVPISNLMLEFAPAAAEVEITEQISRDMSLKKNRLCLLGTGSSGQPLGILNDPDIGTLSVTDPAITYEEVEDMVEVVELADALMDGMKWALHPTMSKLIRRGVPGTTGLDLERLVMGAGPAKEILGYPQFKTTQFVATSGADAAIFGDWTQFLLANFKGIEIRVTDVGGDSWEKDETEIRAIERFDCHRRTPGSFVKSA